MSQAVLAIVIPSIFGGVSLVAGGLNLVFLRQSIIRNRAVLQLRGSDATLGRISRGFIFTWGFIVFNDAIRVAVGAGTLLGHPTSIYLLLLSPFGSLLVAIVGLRSFR